MPRRVVLLLLLALAAVAARPGPLDGADDAFLTGTRGGATGAADGDAAYVHPAAGGEEESDDDWWTTSRGAQADSAVVAGRQGAAQADGEGSLFLQQQLNALDAAAYDQQPGGAAGQATQQLTQQGGSLPQGQQASMGGLASGSGTGIADYVQPSGTGDAASTVQATSGQQLHTSTQQQQLDAEGDGDADAAQDDYEPAGAAGGDGDGEEQAGGEEDEEGGSQQATQGGSVYEGDFLDGDDDSSSSSSAAHESEGEGDGEGDGSSGGEEEEQHSVFAAGSASGTGMEQRQLIQDWDSSAAGSADSGSELGTEAGALHDGLTAGGDEEGEDDEAGEGEDDDVEYSRSSADGSSGSLRQEGVGDDEWDEDDEPSQHAGGQAATQAFDSARGDDDFTHGLPGN